MTALIDYPTIAQLARHIEGALFSEGDELSSRAIYNVDSYGEDWRVAVVGASCRFPGSDGSLSSFWNLLHNMKSALNEMPYDRFDIDEHYDTAPDADNKLYVRHGGFIEGADLFAAKFFNITKAEVFMVDPQQRLLLEVGYEALHTAGQDKGSLMGSDTGVFVGISTMDWGMIVKDRVSVYSGTGHAQAIAANRIPYSLGLTGPSVSMDTACSSSLVALDAARDALRLRKCSLALLGGVNLMLDPKSFLIFCKASMLAKDDGRCKAFDAAADGYVRGEGIGAVVLKRLPDAQTEGSKDRILAILRGTAVNQDGRSAVLTAPKGPAQEAVIKRALQEARLQAGDISYVIAHGTGTALGDPIEAGALKGVFGPGRSADRPESFRD